jgi:hypothetical protein
MRNMVIWSILLALAKRKKTISRSLKKVYNSLLF